VQDTGLGPTENEKEEKVGEIYDDGRSFYWGAAQETEPLAALGVPVGIHG